MYDNGTFRLPIASPPEIWESTGQIFELYGLVWQPRVIPETKQTKSYLAERENLRFVLKQNEIKVSNSLQKFLTGNNHESFGFPQFGEAIDKLNHATGLQWEAARVSRIEYGENVNWSYEPMDFLNRMLSYKGKSYQKMVSSNGVVYGTKVVGWDYEIKAYDKALEVALRGGKRLSRHIIRIEIVAKKMGYLRDRADPIPIYTVADLLSQEIQKRLIADVVDKIENTLYRGHGNLEKFTDAELRTIAIVENETIFDMIQKRNPRSAARYRKQYALAWENATPKEPPTS